MNITTFFVNWQLVLIYLDVTVVFYRIACQYVSLTEIVLILLKEAGVAEKRKKRLFSRRTSATVEI